MIQTIRANDVYKSQLFQWDATQQIISLPHGKEVWFAKLGEDGNFHLVKSKPKREIIQKSK